jgi:hypothetical protein
MRTTKRFTPKVLDRFAKRGRGEGTYKSYRGWHQVTRSDPSSRGQSHIIPWNDRQHDLLSGVEKDGFLFAHMLRVRDTGRDLVEQLPLQLESTPHFLARYTEKTDHTLFPGTLELAEQLNIRHPVVTGEGERKGWVMSTDMVLVEFHATLGWVLTAVSIKDDFNPARKRVAQLLRLEREYWAVRGVRWLLITPDLYDVRVARTLKRYSPWVLLHEKVRDEDLSYVSTQARILEGLSFTATMNELKRKFGNSEYARSVWWQAVWKGLVPLDLRRDWRPHQPIRLLTIDQFDHLNPIRAERSAWK